jgi:D-cysteine desulfhydrase family pyridoxal phosphate-dependent enzyme
MAEDRIPLATLPTPLEPLDGLRRQLGAAPRLWVKRDDLTGLGGGGNKLRKLEYLLAEAQREGTDVVLTSGALQSNHARLTAAACARLGLPCELFLNRRVPKSGDAYERSGNLLLDRLFGAQVRMLARDDDPELAAEARAGDLRGLGQRPYVIPTGGSNAVGARGYARCAHELLDQLQPDAIVLPTASGGTLAGLSAGLGEAGWDGRLIGIAVSATADEAAGRVTPVAAELTPRPAPFTVEEGFLGPGYGVLTDAAVEAIRLAAGTEGLLLDPVYSGKAMAGLLALVRAGRLDGARDVVFVHTGGIPGLFAYEEEL